MQRRQRKWWWGVAVGLVAHRLRRADRAEDPQFVQLGQGRVDGPATELGDVAQRPRVHLLGGEVLGRAAGEGAEDRPPLGGDAQRMSPQELAGIFSHRRKANPPRPAASSGDLMFRLTQDGYPIGTKSYLGGASAMIMRLDRLQAEIPPPSDPDPNGASIVQELLGGKFGEMSTFMNYTYQSFNFRNRQGARPFYDLVASIAAEEFGHIELVSTAINTMLTGALDGKPGKRGALKGLADCRNSQQFLAGAASATVQDSMGKPWSGDYVNATGDLIGDLTHNFFLETGARNNKLKVYEAVDHPAARALTGYLLVRGGVHQVAYARALENLTGAKMEKLFPTPRIPTDKIPECQPHIKRGEHLKLYRWSPDDFKELSAVFNGPHPETGEELEVAEEIHPEGAPAYDLPPQEALFAPGPDAGEIEEIAQKLRGSPPGCRKSRPGSSPRKAKSRKPKKR